MNEWINTIIVSVAILIVAHYVYETFFTPQPPSLNTTTTSLDNEKTIEKYKSMMDDLAKALQEKETQVLTEQNTQSNTNLSMQFEKSSALPPSANTNMKITSVPPTTTTFTDMEQQWMSTQLHAFLGKLHASFDQ